MRKPHANNAHRRVSTSQPSPTRPVISAAIANANGTVNPTYPRYRIGGWNSTRTWFCSNGLGPWPSKPGPTAGPAANGFAGPKATSAKKAHTTNITTSAQADERVVEPLAEPPRHRRRETGQHHHPQQDRALEGAPHRGHVVERRRRTRPDLLDVGERVVAHLQRALHGEHRDERPGKDQPGVHRCLADAAAVPGDDRQSGRQRLRCTRPPGSATVRRCRAPR